MYNTFAFYRKRLSLSVAYVPTVIVWISGLLLGLLVARSSGDKIRQLVFLSAVAPASLAGEALVVVFPVLAAVLLCRFRKIFSLIILFWKAAAFSCVACVCMSAFGSAGWLVRTFLFFSDTACTLLLLFVNLAVSDRQNQHLKKSVAITVIAVSVAVGLFDFLVISPYLVSLFT